MKVEEEYLAAMRQRAGLNTKWAAYQNVALDATSAGHIQYLKFGEGCTHTTRPETLPDTSYGAGWKYRFVGLVNLDLGIIETDKEKS